MANDGTADRKQQKAGIGDVLELGANAFVSGLAVAIALAVITLALATSSQAAGLDQKTGTLLLQSTNGSTYLTAPKLETDVAVRVTGMVARTRLTQIFKNPGTESVEGIYVFPLPENAAVDHLWMRVGDRAIEGRIEEKESARKTYQQAKSEGRKAALVEQQRPNLFTNAVAHIGAGEYVRVTIEYQQTLSYESGIYRLRFPLAVTPRYVPAGGASDAIPDVPKAAEAIESDGPIVNPTYADGCGPVNPVDIVVVIDSGLPLGDVKSSYDDVSVQKEAGNRTVVSLSKDQEEADHDFELTWTFAALGSPQAAIFTEKGAGADYALLMVAPPQPTAAQKLEAQRLPREMILVIDTSGSMTGPSIEQAKAAVIYALESLSVKDRFNVLEFNSVTRTFMNDALPATPENIAQAKTWVASLRARGGTEMAPALTFALNGSDTLGYLRQVIFMTDGGVGNEAELFKLIASRLGASRLFTVGIGSAPNGHFMTRAAELGRGTFTYIADVREVNEKMTRLFAKIEAPVLRDVAIRWADGSAVETFPARVPDLYLGEPVVVAASAPSMSRTLIVSGTRGNEPWSVALTPTAVDESTGVGVLWARAKIASLMGELSQGAELSTIRPQVVKVALDHHLVSAYTSLVAVDPLVTAQPGDGKTMRVNASLPRGYVGGLPQTATPATLQLLLGLLALATAGIVAIIGRRAIPARG